MQTIRVTATSIETLRTTIEVPDDATTDQIQQIVHDLDGGDFESLGADWSQDWEFSK